MGHGPGQRVGCCPGQGLAPSQEPSLSAHRGGTEARTGADHKQRLSPPGSSPGFRKELLPPLTLPSSRKEAKITLSPRSVSGPQTLIFHLGLLPWQPCPLAFGLRAWARLGHLTTEQWPWIYSGFQNLF